MAANINAMHEYLEQVIGVTSHGMRNRLIENGFTDLDALVTMDKEGVEQTCSTIRKSTTAPKGSPELELMLKRVEKQVMDMAFSHDPTKDEPELSQAAKLLLAELARAKTHALIPTDKTNTFQLMDLQSHCSQMKVHPLSNRKPALR